MVLLAGSAVLADRRAGVRDRSGEVGEDVLVERWLPARWPNFAVGMVLAELVLRPTDPLGRGGPAAGS